MSFKVEVFYHGDEGDIATCNIEHNGFTIIMDYSDDYYDYNCFEKILELLESGENGEVYMDKDTKDSLIIEHVDGKARIYYRQEWSHEVSAFGKIRLHDGYANEEMYNIINEYIDDEKSGCFLIEGDNVTIEQ